MMREEKMVNRVKRERNILSATSKHPDMFVMLHAAFQTRSHLFLVMDFAQGGDCLSLIGHLGKVPEACARTIVAEVMLAVKTLHAHGMVVWYNLLAFCV